MEVKFHAFLMSALIGGKLEAPVAFPVMLIDYEVGWVTETAWTFWRGDKYLTPAMN
jgi:hypothetical protein